MQLQQGLNNTSVDIFSYNFISFLLMFFTLYNLILYVLNNLKITTTKNYISAHTKINMLTITEGWVYFNIFLT